jgi:hypothetical protein
MRLRATLLAAPAALLLSAPATHASVFTFTAVLSGPQEVIPNTSPGTGFAVVTLDNFLHTLDVNVTFADLEEGTTASHIHCCTAVAGTGGAGVATMTPRFTDFPLGVTSGTYSRSFDTTDVATYNAPFVTASGGTAAQAEAALLLGMLDGKAYFNIHTTAFPGGEIRGFLTEVPEPTTLMLLGGGLGLAALRARPRRR